MLSCQEKLMGMANSQTLKKIALTSTQGLVWLSSLIDAINKSSDIGKKKNKLQKKQKSSDKDSNNCV